MDASCQRAHRRGLRGAGRRIEPPRGPSAVGPGHLVRGRGDRRPGRDPLLGNRSQPRAATRAPRCAAHGRHDDHLRDRLGADAGGRVRVRGRGRPRGDRVPRLAPRAGMDRCGHGRRPDRDRGRVGALLRVGALRARSRRAVGARHRLRTAPARNQDGIAGAERGRAARERGRSPRKPRQHAPALLRQPSAHVGLRRGDARLPRSQRSGDPPLRLQPRGVPVATTSATSGPSPKPSASSASSTPRKRSAEQRGVAAPAEGRPPDRRGDPLSQARVRKPARGARRHPGHHPANRARGRAPPPGVPRLADEPSEPRPVRRPRRPRDAPALRRPHLLGAAPRPRQRSRPSTTASATPWATSCSSVSRGGSSRPCAAPTPRPASVATSSRSSSRTSRAARRRRHRAAPDRRARRAVLHRGKEIFIHTARE